MCFHTLSQPQRQWQNGRKSNLHASGVPRGTHDLLDGGLVKLAFVIKLLSSRNVKNNSLNDDSNKHVFPKNNAHSIWIFYVSVFNLYRNYIWSVCTDVVLNLYSYALVSTQCNLLSGKLPIQWIFSLPYTEPLLMGHLH